jgi:type VI secretion system protein ImpJ
MAERPVHWHEGMFLRPHHFQAAQRYAEYVARLDQKWDQHYNWGLRAIDVDSVALGNNRLVIRHLMARMHDGTLVSVPDDCQLSQLDLKSAIPEGQSTVDVFLAIPIVSLKKANFAAEGARYEPIEQNLEDENTGDNPQGVALRALAWKLLLSTQSHGGYEVVRILRLRKSTKSESGLELDSAYIPPVLACDAWEPLHAGILQEIFDRLGSRIDLLASQVVSRRISFDSQGQGEALLLAQLAAMNEGYGLLTGIAFAQGVHPFPAFLELCRLVGKLAIFGEARRPPADLPHYDHDDLDGCFHRLQRLIHGLLHQVVEPDYKQREFTGAGQRMQVNLEPVWLESNWQLFVGVQGPTNFTAEECNRLLSRSNALDMKIGSSDRVEQIFARGEAGLRFTLSPRPPRALPLRPGLTYFQVNRDSQPREWENVQRELTLAIRLNENRIAGKIDGQRELAIRTESGQGMTLQFTLFVVPQEKGPGPAP